MAAVLAGAAFVVVPKIEHGLAEGVHNIGAIEIDVLDERAAFVAVKDDVLVLTRWSAALHDDADGIRRAHGSVRNIRRNEKRFALADEVIDDPIAF
ncbi:MAG TPA: hypothetical protein VH252_05210, partial [Chthoniobacterales bacterium]|nr:hypothetical protein [Chthoniobacterales bacterium]